MTGYCFGREAIVGKKEETKKYVILVNDFTDKFSFNNFQLARSCQLTTFTFHYMDRKQHHYVSLKTYLLLTIRSDFKQTSRLAKLI